MKVACVSFTDKGKIIGDKFKSINEEKYTIHHYENSKEKSGIKKLISNLWNEYDALIFISSTGMAIRLIQPYIKNKTIDPAVVVVDDTGKFSISLLSGHLGGANELAKWIGNKIIAIPVITTASDNRNIEAVDLFAKKNNYHIDNIKALTKVSAMMVNEKNIGFYSEDDKIIDYPNLEIIQDLENIDSNIQGAIIVSSQKIKPLNVPHVILRPKNINVGIGCRKGVDGERIIEAIKQAFEEVDISTKSIKAIGTIEVKKDEKGIIEASKHFNCPLNIFTIDQIKNIEDKFEKSQFVKDTIGVYSVSEPCAYLLGGTLIARKSKYNGITISISKEIKNG